jgi:hypothetical protein
MVLAPVPPSNLRICARDLSHAGSCPIRGNFKVLVVRPSSGARREPISPAAARELGFGILGRPVELAARRSLPGVDLERIDHDDPLRYALSIPETNVHVIAQRHDALTPLAHVAGIRRKYPGVAFHEFDGTHLYPAGLASFQKRIRELI